MIQVDTLSAQAASNYVLSPDAEVFIPQQYKAAAAPVLIPKDAPIIPQSYHVLADGGSKHPNRMGSNYTTPIHADACAVLTNGDVGGWQVPGRLIGGKKFSGKNSNRGGKFNGPCRPARRQMEEPLYSVPITAPHPPMLYNRLNYPAATLAADGSNYVYVQYPAAAPPGYNFNPPPPPPPPPPLPPTQGPLHGAPPRGHPIASTVPYGLDPTIMPTGYIPPAAPPNVYAANAQNYEEWPEMKQAKPVPPIANNNKTLPTNKVNIGIQKEPSRTGANNNVKSGIQHKKAIYEMAVQTDFSEEIANLTLSEKPSPLFGNKKRMRNHSNQWISNLTDSEEKDSDSGYSSPLHRRNLVSNGTHAAPERLVSPARPAVPAVTQPVGFSYAAVAQRPAKTVQRFVTTPAASSAQTPAQESAVSDGKNLEPKPGEENVKKKRKRNRSKKKKEGGNLSSPGQTQGSSLSNSVSMDDIVLHYEDEEEFPELSANIPRKEQAISAPKMNYCDMLKNNSVIYQPPSAEEGDLDENGACNKKDGRITRRWQKRQEIANRAAEEELAEIILEQQMLIQRNIPMKKPTSAGSTGAATTAPITSSTKPPLNTGATPGLLSVSPSKPSAPVANPGKKSKQPFALDIRAMIDALEKRQEDPAKKEVLKEKFPSRPLSGNTLDSNAPSKRGKERETPKAKKPSPLKKVILKEREEKKRLRLLEVDPTGSALDNDLESTSVPVGLGVVNAESDLSQDAASVKGEHGGAMTPASADLSPVSQTSPISISPLSSGVNSPITGATEKDVNPAVLKIHSRRFREYCNQILDKDIDTCCTTLLRDLVSFQDRLYHKDPVKAKMRRRIVLGLREVTKHLRLKKLKCVIISPNLEKIQSKGGLDDALNNILNLCTDQDIPFVFALGRRALGRACAKLVPVSVVGIFNYEGSEENFQKLMELTEKARQSYVEMVAMIEKDIQENIPQIYSNTAQIFAHMGHSRTPSGCSGISFASSILSEPISENYPQSEPETDSRGNEIAKREIAGRGESEMKISPLCLNQVCVSSSMMGDIDDGNEADTEDCNDPASGVQAMTSVNNVNHLESLSSADVDREDSADEEDDIGSGNNSLLFQEALGELPHIDSIHSATYELNTEILSQHSVRTIGDTSEVMSTHSSKTIGEGSSTIVTDTYSEQGQLDKTTTNCAESSINLTRVKAVEKDKLIQDWVKASQTCIDEEGDSSEQETAKEEEEEEEEGEEEGGGSGASSCGSNKDLVAFPALCSSPVALATGVQIAAAAPPPSNILECDITPCVGKSSVHSIASSTTANNIMTAPCNTSVTTAVSFELSS